MLSLQISFAGVSGVQNIRQAFA